ncbi:MAG: hypothetical protein R3E89_00840 [Thiolinea sp.]
MSILALDTPVGKDGDSPLVDFVPMEEERATTAVLEEEESAIRWITGSGGWIASRKR